MNTGFNAGLKTLFVWEGVTNYLTAEAVDSGFRAMRKLAMDVSIIFTYVGSVEFRTRYIGNDPRQLRGYEFYRVAVAEGR